MKWLFFICIFMAWPSQGEVFNEDSLTTSSIVDASDSHSDKKPSSDEEPNGEFEIELEDETSFLSLSIIGPTANNKSLRRIVFALKSRSESDFFRPPRLHS